MTAFLAIVSVTIRQLTGRKRTFLFAVLSLAPSGLLFAASRARDVFGVDTDLGALSVAPFFAFVIPITALILAGAALGDERRDKTLSFVVLRPIGRLQIAAAKTLAACIVTIGFATVGAVGLAVTFAAVGGSVNILPSILVGASLACILYSSIFVLLGNLTSRPTVIGLTYVLFIENVMVLELPRLASGSPWRVGLAASIDLMPEGFPARALLGAIGDVAPSAPAALLATTLTAVSAVGVCALFLKRTDSV